MTTFDDFRLRITTSDEGRYSVAADAAGGEGATASFELPFSAADVENLVLRVGRPRRLARSRTVSEVKRAEDFGGNLFETVFSGEVREVFRAATARAEDGDRGLRLVLSLRQAPELIDLPWEFLFDRPFFLGLRRITPVVRCLELAHSRRPAPIGDRVRILGMVASPTGYDKLDVLHERKIIDDALAPLVAAGQADIVWLDVATLRELNRVLSSGDFHIFHYVGHAGFDTASGEGHLVLEGPGGGPHEISGSDMGNILCDYSSLRLVVLNACEGARTSTEDPFSGVATSLIEREIPAVVAMQFEITDEAALVFADAFYGALVDRGQPVDIAVSQARKEIYANDPSGLEWGTPVLFVRVPDAELFDFGARTASSARTKPNEPPPPATGTSDLSPGPALPAKPPSPTIGAPPPAESATAEVARAEAARADSTKPDGRAAQPGPLGTTESDRQTAARTANRARAADRSSRADVAAPAPPPRDPVTITPHVRVEEGISFSHGAPLTAAVMSGDGRWIATTGTDGTLAVWSSQTGSPVRRWSLPSTPTDVSLSADGALVAVASGSSCWVYRTFTGAQVALLAPRIKRPSYLRAVQFAPNGRVLAAGNETGDVECWAVDSWRSIGQTTPPNRGEGTTRIRFHASSQRMAIGTAAGSAWFWDLSPNRRWQVGAVESAGFVNDLAYASDGGRLAVASRQGFVLLVDALSDRVVRRDPTNSSVETLDLSPDGKWLVAATADQTIRVWDGSGTLQMKATSTSVLSRVRFSSNGRGLLTAGADGVARIWRVIES